MQDPISTLASTNESQPGYLHGAILIAGTWFHAEAVRVVDDPADGQRPDIEDNWMYVESMMKDDALFTVKIPNHPGDWVLWITPFRT